MRKDFKYTEFSTGIDKKYVQQNNINFKHSYSAKAKDIPIVSQKNVETAINFLKKMRTK